MGDAAGELADRFQLLALAQPRLEVAPFGDVAGDADESRQPFPVVGERPGAAGLPATKALDDASVRKRIGDLGGSIPGKAERTPAAFDAYVKAEVARWAPILKASAQ